jgi:hypothetical protein
VEKITFCKGLQGAGAGAAEGGGGPVGQKVPGRYSTVVHCALVK